MDKNNPAFTGFFNKDHKRIDLVLVMKDRGTYRTELMRLNYLTNIIKFGLELELDAGKMADHRNLIFVKVHAPDLIIEDYGLYFNIRKFFKHSHGDYINPFLDPLGMKNERELLKLVREQYPEPVHYSTLERSKIVYNIIRQLPFGIHETVSGINQLVAQNIILDAFALHDGPYFIASGQQSTHINARQTLFYNWVGIVNIWRTQPIHMIQEYLGESVAFYFAYYEYFNIMLLFPATLGFLIAMRHYYGEIKLDSRANIICHDWRLSKLICPQCRHFDLCPFRHAQTYCRELKFIKSIDTPHTITFLYFVSIWSIFFAVLWTRREKYLTWMWEITKQYDENLINPDYYHDYSLRKYQRSTLIGVILHKLRLKTKFNWILKILLSVGLFGMWLFILLIISTQIWYVKFWLDKIYRTNENPIWSIRELHGEHLYIGIGAAVYSIFVTGLKMVAKILSHTLTALENNKRMEIYNFSSAIKLYGFYFTGTFALLTFHTLVGHVYYTHLLDMNNWFSIGGFRVMSNRLGTSFDDICITLAVAVVVEQIIVKIPFYVKRKSTDYSGVLSNAPCWEKEYKLDTVKENYFHNEYNNIAIQFAMATLFSITFTLAPFLILFINVWDIRYKAKILLLSCRRPLLFDTSGPGIWHHLILLTIFLVPIFNIFVIGFQSREFLTKHALASPSSGVITFDHQWNRYYQKTNYETFQLFNSSLGDPSPAEEIKKVPNEMILGPHYVHFDCYVFCDEHYYYDKENRTFFQEFSGPHMKSYKYEFLLLFGTGSLLIYLFIYFTFPTQPNDLKDTLYTEARVKQKYYIQKGFLRNYTE